MEQEKESAGGAAAGIGKTAKIAIVAALAVAVALAVAMKAKQSPPPTPESVAAAPVAASRAASPAELPRLVELGSVTCVPCKMMASILEELRREQAGLFQVEFIDVARDRDAAAKFGVRVIPTQVFLDGSGKELFRHEGFFPKEDILAKWKELGVEPPCTTSLPR